MAGRSVAILLFALTAGGCVQTTLEPASDAAMKPRDRQLLANAPYAKASIPQHFQRHIVHYHRRELPGTIVVDSDARYLYYVLPEGKAVRYGVAVGEDALAFSGVAKVGRKEEWPSWVPTKDILQRFEGLPKFVEGGPKIRSVRVASIFIRATRTPYFASTAPISRSISGWRSPPAASA